MRCNIKISAKNCIKLITDHLSHDQWGRPAAPSPSRLMTHCTATHWTQTTHIFRHGEYFWWTRELLLLTSCCCWAGCMLSRLGVPGLKEISCVPSRPSSSACQLPPGRSRVRDRRLQRNTTFIECCNTTLYVEFDIDVHIIILLLMSLFSLPHLPPLPGLVVAKVVHVDLVGLPGQNIIRDPGEDPRVVQTLPH